MYICPVCGEHISVNDIHQCGKPLIPNSFNYRCPDCFGEFNQPILNPRNGTYFEYKCPFCGRIMEGLN